MKKAIAIEPTADELKLRVLQAKAKLGADFRLRAVWQYAYGSVTDNEFYVIQNCWLTKSTDEEITKNIERLAENKQNLPLNP